MNWKTGSSAGVREGRSVSVEHRGLCYALRVHSLHAAAAGGGAPDYYAKAMMTVPMRWFCRMSGKRKFSEENIAVMKAAAALKTADRNPYSWNMDFIEYPDGSGYEGRFTKCGICTLMRELGLYDLTPAMCHLDYTMAEAGGAADFVREYTLASGGPYCDCGYKKKTQD